MTLNKLKYTEYSKEMYLSKKSFLWSFLNNIRIKKTNLILEKLNLGKSRILEIGAYDGFFISNFLIKSKLEIKNYSCLDIYSKNKVLNLIKNNLEILKKEKKIETFKIIDNACETINLNNKYDLIFIFETLEHVKNEKLCIKNISEILNKDGKLIISMPIEKWAGAGIKDLGRKIILGKSNHSLKELLYIFMGNLKKVKKQIGSHQGYDYEETINQFKKHKFKIEKIITYPFNIKYIDYGAIIILKK